MSYLSTLTNFAEAIKINANEVGAPVVAANSGSVSSLLTTVYIWAGIICVVVMIIGGFRYTTSNGDSSGITSGKNTILYGLVGLVIIIMAAAITGLIVGRF